MDLNVLGALFALLITPITLSAVVVATFALCTVQKIRNSGRFATQSSCKYFVSALIFLVANVVGLVLLYAMTRAFPTVFLGPNFLSLLIFIWLPINLIGAFTIPAAWQKIRNGSSRKNRNLGIEI
jgi:uncharacterized membrane protein